MIPNLKLRMASETGNNGLGTSKANSTFVTRNSSQTNDSHTQKSPYSRNSSLKNYKVQHLLNEIWNAAERDASEQSTNQEGSTVQKSPSLTIQMIHSYYRIRNETSLRAELKRRSLIELLECQFHTRNGDWKYALSALNEYEMQIREGLLKNGTWERSSGAGEEGFSLSKKDQKWALKELLKTHRVCVSCQCEQYRREGELELLYVKLSQLRRVVKHEIDITHQRLQDSSGQQSAPPVGKKNKKELKAIQTEMRELKEVIRWQFRQYSINALRTQQSNARKQNDGSVNGQSHISPQDEWALIARDSAQELTRALPLSASPQAPSTRISTDSMVLTNSTSPTKRRKHPRPPSQKRTPSVRRYSSQSQLHDSPYVQSSEGTSTLKSPSAQSGSTPLVSPRSASRKRRGSTPVSTKKYARPSFFKSFQILDQIVPKAPRSTVHESGSQSARRPVSSRKSSARTPSARAPRRNSFHEQVLSAPSSASSTTTIVQRREKTQIDYIVDRLDYIRSALVENGSYEDALSASKNILLTVHIGEISKQPAVFVDLYALTSNLHEKLGDIRLSINFRRKAVEIAEKYHLRDLLRQQKSELARICMHAGRYEEAVQAWLIVLSMSPADLPILLALYENIAQCYCQSGSHKESIRYLSTSVELMMSSDDYTKRDYLPLFVKIAEEYGTLGDYENAVSYYEEALNSDGRKDLSVEAHILSRLGDLYSTMRNGKRTAKLLQQQAQDAKLRQSQNRTR